MGHLYQASKQLAAADADAIAESQSPGAGAITLDGTLVSGGVATLDTPRRVLITSAGDDSGITFTVTGTNYTGNPLTETVTGANAGTVATTQDFATVTEVTHTGTVAGAITIGTNGVGSTPWFNVATGISPINLGIAVIASGTVNYDVEYTYDDLNVPFSGTFPTVFSLASIVSATATSDGSILSPVNAVRAKINSGTGSISLLILQAGLPRC